MQCEASGDYSLRHKKVRRRLHGTAVVMEQFGHSTIALTMNVYSHLIPALQRDAADRMDAMLGGASG